MKELITTTIEQSDTSEKLQTVDSRRATWFKVGVAAMFTAAAGGLAAVWYYRKALSQLQHAEAGKDNSNFGSPEVTDGDGV